MDRPWQLKRVDQPWGDYGDLLAYGMTRHLGRNNGGELQLERTGPLVPALFLTGVNDLLMIDGTRDELVGSNLVGLAYRPVNVARIVHLDWHLWDQGAEDPVEYPSTGESEDYVLSRPHDPDLAAAIGPIWELVVHSAQEQPHADFARVGPGELRPIVVSDRAADWIASHHGQWIRTVPSTDS